MYFGQVNVAKAIGCYLAHSQKTPQGRIPKGSQIDAALIEQLLASGITRITVAKLDTDDVHEDEAAQQIAQAVCGQGTRIAAARAGRVNLYSKVEGLCEITAETIVRANSIDEAITIATVAPNQWLPSGKMLATIKIIPYAVRARKIAKVIAILAENPISVAQPFTHKAALIQTFLPSIKNSVLDKTRDGTELRLQQRKAQLVFEHRCEHTVAAVTDSLREALDKSLNWLLITGASAVSDREDVIPASIIDVGGTIDRYGLAVDPGNLLLLAHIGSLTVVGLPGCARSSRYNGLDYVLDRLACRVPITEHWINSLSVGGLMTEIADRPRPRVTIANKPEVGGLLLAAGTSSRAGALNKLLHPYRGATLVEHAATSLKNSNVTRIVAVTGFEHERLSAMLTSSRIECHHNLAYHSGMASSLAAGVSKLIESDAIIVCLGDMPHVSTQVINQLIDAFSEHKKHHSLFIPTYHGTPGNPVLISRVFFDTLLTLEGDTGARFLVKEYPDKVHLVNVDCKGIHQDYDTKADLLSLENGE